MARKTLHSSGRAQSRGEFAIAAQSVAARNRRGERPSACPDGKNGRMNQRADLKWRSAARRAGPIPIAFPAVRVYWPAHRGSKTHLGIWRVVLTVDRDELMEGILQIPDERQDGQLRDPAQSLRPL